MSPETHVRSLVQLADHRSCGDAAASTTVAYPGGEFLGAESPEWPHQGEESLDLLVRCRVDEKQDLVEFRLPANKMAPVAAAFL
jgi:hypothetical protein